LNPKPNGLECSAGPTHHTRVHQIASTAPLYTLTAPRNTNTGLSWLHFMETITCFNYNDYNGWLCTIHLVCLLWRLVVLKTSVRKFLRCWKAGAWFSITTEPNDALKEYLPMKFITIVILVF